jgi:hypothetical protein
MSIQNEEITNTSSDEDSVPSIALSAEDEFIEKCASSSDGFIQTSAASTKKKTIRTKIGIRIKTTNINHTALYKHASELPGFKVGAFKAIYRSEPYRFKDTSSREHDEVISRAIKAMGLSLQFFVGGSKKTPIRYVEVYGSYTNEDEQNQLTNQLKTIVKKFQRIPENIEIMPIV